LSQTLTFIHLGDNPRLVSGYSRKAYQVEIKGNTVIRTWGPIDSVGRKTKWARTKSKIETFNSVAEMKKAVDAIVRTRLDHDYRVALPGEVPVN
jgi:predicted DNA-binding WGR domain protein